MATFRPVPAKQISSCTQRQRLRVILLTFLILLTIPLAFLGLRSYEQLKRDALQKYAWKAQHIVKQMNDQISSLMQAEDNRPPSDYQFYKLSDQEDYQYEQVELTLSPLASIPEPSHIPGIIGFFQVDNDGLFSCPTLPYTDNDALKKEYLSDHENLPFNQMDERLEKREQIRRILMNNRFLEPGEEKTGGKEEEPIEIEDILKPFHQNEVIVKIDPFNVTRTENNILIFFRDVWRGEAKLTQGFMVHEAGFLLKPLKHFIQASAFNTSITLLLADQANTFAELIVDRDQKAAPRSEPSKRLQDQGVEFYASQMFKPLNGITLTFTTLKTPLETKAITGLVLLGVLFFLIVLGLFVIYRLGCRQIALNEERLNFVSAVSHELKTPLTSIIMYAEMLRDGMVFNEQRKRSYYDFIYSEGERLGRLINNVLRLTKIGKDTPDMTLKYMPVSDLSALIQRKVLTLIDHNQFELKFCDKDFSCDSYEVLVDTDAFTQISLNLVDNAIKFSSEYCEKEGIEKRIEIGFRCPDYGANQLCFSVRDYGPGISQQDAKHIFHLFFRSGNELTRKTQGTGIGLALVSELCRAMKGKVDFVNHPNGVEFHVFVPTRRIRQG